MSKELEAFNKLMEESPEVHIESYEIVVKALQRLESIDNAKPSEALKGLEKYLFNEWKQNHINFGCDYKLEAELDKQLNNLKSVKQALQRLEEINNAKPIEALECLEYIENKLKDLEYIAKQNDNEYLLSKYIPSEKFNTIKQALLKAQEQEKENTRNEEILQKYYQEGITLDSVRALKQERDNYKRVLEIIKETENVKVSFYENGSGKHYKLEFDRTRNQTITQEEFDLLKRWLG